MKPIRNPIAAPRVPDTGRDRCSTWRLRQSARCLLAVSISLCLLPPLAFTAVAQTAAPAQGFTVAAGDLKEALYQFGEQSSLQIVYAPELVQGKTTQGVAGSHSPAQALQRLLAGTGLVAEAVNASTVVLKKASPEQPPQPRNDPATSAPPPVAELEKVVVTGSRLPQASMEGPQQVKLYSSADIARSGQKTVMDFLNTLPAVSSIVSEGGFDTVGGAGAVRLRGLPVGSTLVLLDGRPVEGAASGQSNGNPFDVSNIPIAAVERIEVVPEAASAVYGSDAIGGVVNIILRKDLDGGEVSVTTGSPTGGAYRDTTVSAAWGTSFERGNVSVVGSFQTRGALLNTDRKLTADADYRRYGGPDTRSTSCAPGNVYSADGSNLPGLSSPFAGIPVNGGSTPADFLGTAGVLNRCSGGAFGGTIIPATRRGSVMANGTYDIGDTTQAFFQAMYSQVRQEPYAAPRGVSRIAVPADNPFNPFGVPVNVTYRFATEGRYGAEIGTSMFSRLLGGVKGALNDRWEWELAVWQSGDHMRTLTTNKIDMAALFDALASRDPAESINLFSAGSPASRAVLDRILYDAPGYMSSKLQAAGGFVRGELVDLPAGPVSVVLGGEYDHMRQSILFESSGRGQYTSDAFSRNVRSLFGEARIPLIASADSHLAEKLALTFAARYDAYSDFGNRFTPQGGIEFRPTDTLLLRASYADAFKAPDLRSVYASPVELEGIEVSPDPLRGGEMYPTNLRFGGNRNLKPQTGRSRSIGAVWSSPTIENLQIGLTNFRVTQGDRITQPSDAVMLANPGAFPGRVIRAAPTAEDIARGYAGRLLLVDASYLNYGELTVEGFDLSVDYKWDTGIGTFRPSLNVTEIYKYDAAVAPGQPMEDRLGYASDDAFATRWKGTLALGYTNGPWSAQVAGRYVSRYEDYDRERTLGRYWLFDASLHYDIGKGFGNGSALLSQAYAEISVVNVFNREPQFSNYFGSGYDPRIADVRGRFLSLSLGSRW